MDNKRKNKKTKGKKTGRQRWKERKNVAKKIKSTPEYIVLFIRERKKAKHFPNHAFL